MLSLLATLLVAVLVYSRQSQDHTVWTRGDSTWKQTLDKAVKELGDAVSAVDEMVRGLAEKQADAENQQVEADSEPEPGGIDGATRQRALREELTQSLRHRGVQIHVSRLAWKKKTRCNGDHRGNLGWFVDDGGDKRFFIHRGRTTTVRTAIPRPLLEAWESHTGRTSCEIELDYQTGAGRGNHAWFVRTYDGGTWRITKGGQGKNEVTVVEIEV